MSAQALLVVANAVLTAIAGFFIRGFVKDVHRLTEKVAQMDRDYHSRLSVLETKNGIYNQHTGPTS